MNYIITELITSEKGRSFYLLGQASDKKAAAEIAAAAYKEYNRNASEQNITMITEWLATRKEYSFRLDRKNRLQLSIVALDETKMPEPQLLFRCAPDEDDQLLHKISAELFPNGISKASLPGSGPCRVTPQK